MLAYDGDFKRGTSEYLRNYAKTHKFSSLSFTDFLDTMLKTIDKETENVTYPKVVRVAKSPLELARGDFEPAYTITLEGCPVRDSNKIWQCTSEKECKIQLGYENFDKRYLSEFSLDAKTLPHATLAGSTGSGKSVTLNAILMSAFYLYPPWELQAYMADPKINEFKRYGTVHHIPHIRTIAATGDMSYVRSMLVKLKNDMMLLNQAFAKADVRNLADFREVTKLAVPRNLIVIDEYQTMIKQSSKSDLKVLIDMIDLIARLGRNTGYNLFLCSQEVDPVVKPILKNVLNRFCLKVDANVSDLILGNPQGTNGRVGVLFATSDPSSGDIDLNHKFMVPYQDNDGFAADGKFLEEAGKRVGYKTETMFYDENAHLELKQLDSLCRKRKTGDSLIIGEPSFISDTPEFCELKFSNTGVDNVLIFALRMDDVTRYFKTLFHNALDDLDRGLAKHFFLVANKSILGDLTKADFPSGSYFPVESVDAPSWVSCCEQVYIVKLALAIDAGTSERPVYDVTPELVTVFSNLFGKELATKINLSRFNYLINQLNSSSMMGFFGYKEVVVLKKKEVTGKPDTPTATLDPIAEGVAKRVMNYIWSRGSRFQDHCLTIDDVTPTYLHVLGADVIKGLGRDGYRNLDYYKNLLYDAYYAKIRFIFYINSVYDGLASMKSSFHYQILDGVSKFSSKVGCEEYPQVVPDVCGVLYDTLDLALPCKCFKKVFLEGDLW